MDFISKMNEGLVVNFQPLYCMSLGALWVVFPILNMRFM